MKLAKSKQHLLSIKPIKQSSWLKITLKVALIILLILLYALCQGLIGYSYFGKNFLAKLLLIGMALVITLSVLWLNLKYPVKRNKYAMPAPLNKKKTILTIIGIILLSVIGIMAVNLISSLFYANQIPPNQKEIMALTQKMPLSLLILSAVIAPIFEETIFRRELIVLSGSRTRLIVTYLLASALFAMAHITGANNTIFSFLEYLMPGLCFGWIYVKYQRIYISILTHSLYNFLVILPLVISIMH